MMRSAEALDGLHQRLAPATDKLITGIDGLNQTAAHVARATEDFHGALSESNAQSGLLGEATKSLNDVANRFLDDRERRT